MWEVTLKILDDTEAERFFLNLTYMMDGESDADVSIPNSIVGVASTYTAPVEEA